MNGLELGADHAIDGFVNHHQVLSTGGRDGRCHQPAADRELIDPGGGQIVPAGRRDDARIGRSLRETHHAVAEEQVQIGHAQGAQVVARLLVQALEPLDAVDLARHLGADIAFAHVEGDLFSIALHGRTETAAAARNVVDEVDGENGENNLIVDFDSEAEDANVTGKAKPVDRMEGILGSGDSGGAAWIKTADGWAIAGTNTWGDESVYGAVSGFSRVSTQLDWIASIYPDFYTVE